ncbi:MAG: hypothetical protein AAF141_07325 [Pseudomonadota bacterium]
MFDRTNLHANDQFTAATGLRTERKDKQLRWLVTLATVLMLGVASVSLSACDSEGTGTDQTSPPAADDTGSDSTLTQ